MAVCCKECISSSGPSFRPRSGKQLSASRLIVLHSYSTFRQTLAHFAPEQVATQQRHGAATTLGHARTVWTKDRLSPQKLNSSAVCVLNCLLLCLVAGGPGRVEVAQPLLG